MSGKPSDTRRLYFAMDEDAAASPGDYKFLNRREVLDHDMPLRGLRTYHDYERGVDIRFGLPKLNATPSIIFGQLRHQVKDFYRSAFTIVSNAAKEIMLQVDPSGIEFAKCAAVDWEGNPLNPYWLVAETRIDQIHDHERSVVRYANQLGGDARHWVPRGISDIYDLSMPDNFNESTRIFSLKGASQTLIVDEVLVTAWRAAGLTGAEFTPLYPPTAADRERHMRVYNRSYWESNGLL
ncbi:hypothetical protein FHS96_005822 [Sphingomonas zeicaulis]|uniref:imm11 family protein n=1 Tax=Sphingomonas zeicaulis TaxID=1632740 RepID=UPI003D25221A